jgi:hypothetical protein
MSSVIIQFTESPAQELSRLHDELHIGRLVEALKAGSMPDNLREVILPLTSTIIDLFGTDTPTIGVDPVAALLTASRDINLSRILRERGLFRLYRLLKTDDGCGNQMWKVVTVSRPARLSPVRKT